jgi:predicted AlkP superfamily pyrophosphatase or phosphodiesterase
MRERIGWLLSALFALTLGTGCQSQRAHMLSLAAQDPQPVAARGNRPVEAIERAILISIDGGRPDLLLRADMPNLRTLVRGGTYSFWARTVPVAITLPSHASMITGVSPERHGVTWNGDVPALESARPQVPTLFEVAMRYGMTTALVAGKSKFDAFARIGHIGKAWVQSANDEQVGDAAVAMLRDYRPEVMMVHFPGADSAGHKDGWGTPTQIAALENIDKQLGKLLAALDELELRGETVILISADHGGAGRTHGGDDPRSQHIPWIINGPGLRQDYDLTQDARLQVRTEDTFSTICYLLGIAPVDAVEGKAIDQVVAKDELLGDAP